jgi:murein DD-endopeptidase MepM/ murein hydrolase activator NlpD
MSGRLPRGLLISLILVVSIIILGGCSIPRWPVGGTMTSPYGLRWRGIRPGLHHGVDVAVPVGTPIRAMRRGKVIRAGWSRGYGWMVMIDHGGQVLSLYAHLSEVQVREGERVDGQQVIGLSGQSGNASGPHLHFEVWRRGWPEDPVSLLGGPPPGR